MIDNKFIALNVKKSMVGIGTGTEEGNVTC